MSAPRAFIAALLVASSASAGAFRCPARGGPPWREYRTRHFLVDTDQTGRSVATLIGDLETLHALLLQALVGEQVEIPGHVRVIAPADPALMRELANDTHIAAYFKLTALDEPLIVLPGDRTDEDREVVAHELAHHISWYLFPMQQHWFSEGLAGFVQTVARRADHLEAATGTHLVKGAHVLHGAGILPREMANWLAYDARPIPAKDLLAWSGAETAASQGRYHLWSWILYHWLWNTRGKQLSDLQRRLSEGEDPAAAWREALPEFDPARPDSLKPLDKALERYASEARYAFYSVDAQGDTAFTESPLGSAQVHEHLLDARNGQSAGAREAELAEALAEDPGDPRALVARAAKEKRPALDDLRKAAAARPRDAVAWDFLGIESPGAAEKEAAYRKAVEIDPELSLAFNNLAWTLAEAGRPKEALPFANRALDLAPWDAGIVDTLAEVAARLGQCRQALQLEHRAAVGWAGEGVRPEYIAKRAGEMAARCPGSP